jgi:hypothetical protein
MPRVRERFAQAEFNVVGRAPVAEVQALHGRNGCRVTGTVPDVRLGWPEPIWSSRRC